jgi:hypothetical protein
LMNRFAVQLDWDYDPTVESQLIASTTLLGLAGACRDLAEIRTPVSTNSLMEFERHFQVFGYTMAARLFTNRFQPEERAAVARAMEGRSFDIQRELGATVEEGGDDD